MEPGAQPRWLDPDERETWLALIKVLLRVPATLDAQLQRDAGISLFEYLVMAALSEAPERTMRLSDLAARAEGTLSRLSQAVARLEKRGWVRRRPDPNDGRATLGILTDEGYRQVAGGAPAHVEAVRQHVFDPLTKAQQRHLREIAERINATTGPDRRKADRF
ncbi:MarR family transcriptional regulator [Virgisporangium aliadipatigenens]|uniref:MarR family transcriptional regulator n=1 Tax=Virgisporangium aliadipatigenens TaxID=741659 RepID=A0A8J3YWR0_9ACTN|nr:MarR family transcriptional regulator [Virgisporangium aliadipatigenens]GIJ51240.1 MarR family transcriptional regulator [Virgisporangium aliadipatigenens]